MTAEEKLRLARQLDTLGVDVIEAGFPSASEGDRRAVRAIAEGIRRPVIAALARCHDRDIDLAGEAVRPAARPRVHVFIATSDLHLECKLRLSRDQCLERAREAVSGPVATPTTSSSRPRTRRGLISNSCAAWSRRPSPRVRRPSISRIR